nr:hypothetical protein [Streptomyces corchorusii]
MYSGTVRTSPLGRIRGITVEGDPMQSLRTRRLIAGSTNDNHVVVMLLSRGNARVEQDKRDVHVRSGALFVYDRASPLRLTFPEPFRRSPSSCHGTSWIWTSPTCDRSRPRRSAASRRSARC